jgi:hypothetical protein
MSNNDINHKMKTPNFLQLVINDFDGIFVSFYKILLAPTDSKIKKENLSIKPFAAYRVHNKLVSY